jgi:hypothetical protein
MSMVKRWLETATTEEMTTVVIHEVTDEVDNIVDTLTEVDLRISDFLQWYEKTVKDNPEVRERIPEDYLYMIENLKDIDKFLCKEDFNII